MGYTVELWSDPTLQGNVKYRTGGVRGNMVFSANVSNNGNIANKDIWADNEIEISCSFLTAQLANYIVLKFENTTIAGEITSCGFTNNNNTIISYVVDYFTSANMTKSLHSDFFTGATGLCARTNLSYPSESNANQLPEPISGNDFKKHHPELTEMINTKINTSLGISQNGTYPTLHGYGYVVTISPFAFYAINENGGNVIPWGVNNSVAPPPNSIQVVTSLTPNLPITYNWYGSEIAGIPICFNDSNSMGIFINAMLSNIGLELELEPYGLGTLNNITRWATIEDSYFTSMGTTSQDQIENMKQTQLIVEKDIYSIKLVPKIMFDGLSVAKTFTHTINTGYGLNNFNPMSDERDFVLPDGTIVHDYSKSKAMYYPYWYFKCITRMGNEITILPQHNHTNPNTYLPDFNFKFTIRLCGGENPKLLITFHDDNDENDVFSADSGVEWHIIYEFPNIPWSSSTQSQQQLSELTARITRTSQIHSAIIGMEQKGTGYMYGLRGGKPDANRQGGFRAGFTAIGNFVSKFNSDILPTSPTYELDNQITQDNILGSAGNIISSSPHVVTGEGSIDSLLSPPCQILKCGFTDGELFALCRYFDRKGQATNAILNPITNSGSVFGGNAFVSSVGGKTYYEFHDINVTGTMPVNWKNAIETMFIGGCYLVN